MAGRLVDRHIDRSGLGTELARDRAGRVTSLGAADSFATISHKGMWRFGLAWLASSG